MDLITSRYIDPLTDWGFKRLFGSEPNKNILKDIVGKDSDTYELKEVYLIAILDFTTKRHPVFQIVSDRADRRSGH